MSRMVPWFPVCMYVFMSLRSREHRIKQGEERGNEIGMERMLGACEVSGVNGLVDEGSRSLWFSVFPDCHIFVVPAICGTF